MIDAELLRLKEKEEPDLLKIPGVVGVGLRNSRRIMVYVEDSKVASSIPLKVDDVPITVFVTGKIYTLPQLATPLALQPFATTDKFRPAIGGISIGSMDVTAGTLGAVVKDRSTGETLILSNNHVLCYDSETDILTEDGWKPFPDLTYDDKVATMNRETGEMEYNTPYSLQKFKYTGEMIHFEDKQYDLLVTPEHDLWCRFAWQGGRRCTKAKRGQKYRVMKASDVLKRPQHKNKSFIGFTKRVSWNCQSLESVQLPSVEYVRGGDYNLKSPLMIYPWLEFLGYYLSEGSATVREKLKQYIVSIRNKDPNFLKRVYEVSKMLGFHPFYSKWAVRITNKQLCTYLKQFGKCGDKYVPREIKMLPPRQLNIFLDAFIEGDGCKARKGFSVSSKSKRLADDIQEIAFKAGYASSVRPIHGSGYAPNTIYWSVSLTKGIKSMEPGVTPKHVHIEDYNGYVYDCTVKNHVIFIRRNGRAIWSGNSQDWGDDRLGVLGKPIVQPGPFDSGSLADRIGSLKRYVRVDYLNNLIDAALADLDSPGLVQNEILGLGPLAGSSEAYPGMPVVKSGRTTGINYSQVIDVNATITVTGNGEAVFNDQIITSPVMAEGGDSGSALCTMINDRPYIVGLLHAGSAEITVHCKWRHLQDLLNIEVGPEIIIGPPGAPEVAGAMIPFGVIGAVISVEEATKIPAWMK